jgi:L-histidine N-alpha-methyltransferase
MTTIGLPSTSVQISDPLASAVCEGLMSRPKWLPSWLFYDAEGSRLFDQITELPEYYVTRTERGILADHASEIIALAAGREALRLVELGAGSADKTRILLSAAVDRQDTVCYEPVDVSASALNDAQERIEREIPGVVVEPRVQDYTRDFDLGLPVHGERRLVLYIGSSIGNFEPEEAQLLLQSVRGALLPGDCILLGVDQVKDREVLLSAYDDAAGVTADFNLNVLKRLNRELGADFAPRAFRHRAIWNPSRSRIEMHLESLVCQNNRIPTLDLDLSFAYGETIHTENSYKYRPGQTEELLAAAGFAPEMTWTDQQGWFAVCLARVR